MTIKLSRISFRQGPEDEIRNTRLIAAMLEVAARDNPATRQRLYKELLESRFVIPTPELSRQVRPGLGRLEDSADMEILGVPDQNGKMCTPVFTDEEALRQWDPNTPWFGMPAQDFFRCILVTPAEEVVINPFASNRKMLRPIGRLARREFELLAAGKIPS